MLPSDRRVLQVLVVDDSAVVREVMQRILAADDSFVVTTAADPLIAVRKMATSRPDVIVLDLAMPHMDGLSFLRKVMAEDPIPVVICSVMAQGAADVAFQALLEGAVDIVSKPQLGVRGFLEESVALLADTLRAAAGASLPRRAALSLPAKSPRQRMPSVALAKRAADALIAIGASTGGTEALCVLLGALPEDAPGVVVVQHMPAGFTGQFARRLDASCAISVKEAKDGDHVLRGQALIAPGNRHLIVVREGAHFRVRVVDGALVSQHRPSVDVLFRSVAEAVGRSAIGVLLTGMGRDGANGLRTMKERGAWTLAQDEATCVVFGMPKEAIALGGVDDVVPLARIAPTILGRLGTTEK
jgi:two-component system chemotaxis response regulator CheB